MNSNEYMAQYMKDRYHARREEAIDILGGRCVVCGTQENLEIDHIDRSTKSFSVSRLWSIRKELYLEEIQKCQILCKTHHLDKTRSEMTVGHGGGLTGVRNCYCDDCAPLKREYNKRYK